MTDLTPAAQALLTMVADLVSGASDKTLGSIIGMVGAGGRKMIRDAAESDVAAIQAEARATAEAVSESALLAAIIEVKDKPIDYDGLPFYLALWAPGSTDAIVSAEMGFWIRLARSLHKALAAPPAEPVE